MRRQRRRPGSGRPGATLRCTRVKGQAHLAARLRRPRASSPRGHAVRVSPGSLPGTGPEPDTRDRSGRNAPLGRRAPNPPARGGELLPRHRRRGREGRAPRHAVTGLAVGGPCGRATMCTVTARTGPQVPLHRARWQATGHRRAEGPSTGLEGGAALGPRGALGTRPGPQGAGAPRPASPLRNARGQAESH